VNPPVVVQADEKFVVLDGASRITALKTLGYPHAIVQLVIDLEEIELRTWNHVICGAEPGQLVKILDDLPEVSMVESDPDKILDDMLELGGLCYVHTIDGKVFIIQPAACINRWEALNKLTNSYFENYQVLRTIKEEIENLQQEHPDLAALVVFPEYTVEQVLQIAKAGRVLPAGITRFIIPGRVLRLNAELSFLKSDKSLEEKNKWLYELVTEKQAGSRIRYYKEPVYLLDE